MDRHGRGSGCRPHGFSLPELLVVVALLALAVLITVPLAARRVNELRLRSTADQFLVTVRAARMVAVTTGRPTSLSIEPNPSNRYEYTDASGTMHSIELPSGVRIDEASATMLTFRPNGSLEPPAPATVVLKARLPKDIVERWTVTTPISGIPTVQSEQVDADGDDW